MNEVPRVVKSFQDTKVTPPPKKITGRGEPLVQGDVLKAQIKMGWGYREAESLVVRL